MACINLASETPGDGSMNSPVGCPSSPRCHGPLPDTLFINFCNIRGLRSNFESVEHHLFSLKPHLLFLTETQVSEHSDCNRFSIPSYFLYPHFRAKGGCCVYVRNDLTCSRVPELDSPEFSTLWLRLKCHSQTKYLCAVYLSPNSTNFQNFFDYLDSKVEHILSHSPFSEISILGDFNVHHQLWLNSSRTTGAGERAYEF